MIWDCTLEGTLFYELMYLYTHTHTHTHACVFLFVYTYTVNISICIQFKYIYSNEICIYIHTGSDYFDSHGNAILKSQMDLTQTLLICNVIASFAWSLVCRMSGFQDDTLSHNLYVGWQNPWYVGSQYSNMVNHNRMCRKLLHLVSRTCCKVYSIIPYQELRNLAALCGWSVCVRYVWVAGFTREMT